ncbi:GntR family transcriptional regulator [Asaccharospora irregularis]|uniref:DNA-binding transcriptional regulator YhcF, GntR family n=1 Tax=Asaccharospora irregularis DSM 2635 TaxID=1121321 RepID=A0A1M5N876_9FIRM|nr:GntR family transcriptional regulator [Asaccharospora irregularis]SHG85213.1 DNA-binding transcriptional regulator YhcF, GntR family [Asaccharospora irregularis DSM 2635]
MKVEFDNSKPIYTQLVDHLRLKIVSGEMPSGSKVDSVRSMAEEVEVNPNTMQRALAELERLGLVYTQRTRGRFVTEDIEKINLIRKEIATLEISNLRDVLLKLGYSEDELIELINQNLRRDI